MRLREWLANQPAGTQTELSHTRKVSYVTLCRAKRGDRVSQRIAEVISEITGGSVSVAELRPPKKKGRAKKTAKPSKRRAASKSARRAK